MFRTTTLLPALAALLAAPAAAEVYVVHPTPGVGDFTSVAEALAHPALADGDTVWVHAGTYTGALVCEEAIFLEALDGPAATVLAVGGVHVTSAERVTLFDCVIEDNHPTGDAGIPAGGVLVDLGAKALLYGLDVRGNTSLSIGGVLTGPFAEVDVVNCRVRGNGGSGTITGGMLLGGSGRLVNVQVTGNVGTGIGGVYVAGGAGPAVVEIGSCTIYGNWGSSPAGSVGGVFLDDGGDVTIVNTIVYENHGTPGGDVMASGDFFPGPAPGSLDLSYSHVGTPGTGIPMGAGMIPLGLPPLFVAPASAFPAGPTIAGDFGLLPGSPDVDAGLSAAFPLDASAGDLGGVLRELGAAIDMGAYELGASCPAPIYFGDGKPSSIGSVPYLTAEGEPSIAAGSFALSVHDAVPGAVAILFSGPARAYGPFGGGTLYVKGSLGRLGLSVLDGTGGGTFPLAPGPSLAGSTRYYQLWLSDPAHSDGTGVGLSDAVEVTWCD